MKYNNDKIKALIGKILLIIYICSIFLDLHFFYNNYATLFRTIIVLFFFIVVFLLYSNKRERITLCLYFFVYGLFTVIHLFNISDGVISESLYLYKILMNILLIYVVYKLNINKTKFDKILNICILLISGSILICNILKLGYTSYDFNPITGNIFDWFDNNPDYFIAVSGKGYFHLTNQIVAILLMYLPFLLIKLKEKFNIYNLVTLIVLILSMLILGNRLSTYGTLFVLIAGLILHLVLLVIKKDHINIKYVSSLILIILCYCCILLKSPILRRNEYYNNFDTSNVIDIEETQELSDDVSKMDYSIFDEKLININFPKYYYSYENDPEFWNEMLLEDSSILMNSRYIEKKIAKRVIELNNNKKMDCLFGIGYTKIINIQNVEQDFYMQYYTIGLVGCLLLFGIYGAIIIFCSVQILRKFKEKFNFKNIMMVFSCVLLLIAAFFSGNLINSISIIIPYSFILGITLNEFKDTSKSELSSNYRKKLI